MLGLAVYLRMWRRSKPYDPRTGKRVGGILRVIVYALSVSLIVGVVALKKAQADSTDAIRGMSRDLLALQDVLGDGRELRINGETMHVAVGPTAGSVKETLDRFEKHCEENAGVLGKGWAALAGTGATPAEVPAALPAGMAKHAPQAMNGAVKMGTFRSGNDEEGVVVCIVRSESSPQDLVTAFQEFSRTQDLGALGKMRYAFAKRMKSGGAQLMTAWTDEHFSFGALAPSDASGDAPGADSVIVPRLPGSKRLLSAEVKDTSYAVRIYAVPGDAAKVLATYDDMMKKRGFVPLRDDARAERGYVRDGLFVTMVAEPSDSGVTLSFAELGSNVGSPTASR